VAARVVVPDILMNSQKSTQDRLYDNNILNEVPHAACKAAVGRRGEPAG
jgi:hypothetical protein